MTEAVSILYVERVTQDSIFSSPGKNTNPMMFCVSSQVGFPRCQLIIPNSPKIGSSPGFLQTCQQNRYIKSEGDILEKMC